MHVKERIINQQVYTRCLDHGYPEIVARIIAGRTDTFDKNLFQFTLDAIKPAEIMADCTKAAKRIAQAIHNKETILLFTDYDVDGCTSMAVLYCTLHDVFGVPESSIIKLTGHRTIDGYGLTDSVADRILSFRQNTLKKIENNLQKEVCYCNEHGSGIVSLVITADAGISDGSRIRRLANAGIDVIVTDHHIVPKEGIPKEAFAVVNPKRESCPYDSDIAGCGVVWLLMTALSKEMGNFDKIENSQNSESTKYVGCTLEQKQKIHQLLDHVALGTVADLVPLTSVINRYFVKKGLEFMNRRVRPCWQVALNGKDADSWFLAFQLAPRINASSRITSEATTAIDFLIKEELDISTQLYQQLSLFNSDRQKIEKQMFNAAKESIFLNQYTKNTQGLSEIFTSTMPPILIYYSQNNHPGIQGIVAGKLTENFGIPAIMIADIEGGFVAGSGRGGQFLHLRNALQTFDDRFPGIFIAYGGHRAAAGFKLYKDNIELLKRELPKIVIEQLDGQDTTPYLNTDGSLKISPINSSLNNQINLETYHYIEALHPFGIGFPTPLFNDQMVATDVKVMGKTPIHISMMLDGVKSVFFRALDKPGEPLPINSGDIVDVVYTLNLNSWQGRENLQLVVKSIKKV